MEFTRLIPPPDYSYLTQLAQVQQNGVFVASVNWCATTGQVVIHDPITDTFYLQINTTVKDSMKDFLCVEEVGVHWVPQNIHLYMDDEPRIENLLETTWKSMVEMNCCVQFNLCDIRKEQLAQ